MQYKLNEPDASAEVFDGEVLVIHLGKGDYHSLRGAAVAMWRTLVAGYETGMSAAWLASHWGRSEAEVQAEVETLAAELVEKQLLRPADGAGAAGQMAPAWLAELPTAYEAPKIETYSDMQDLLLIDPIHEVDVEGWPHRPPPDKAE